MRMYERPEVMMVENLAEGVYLASGDGAGSTTESSGGATTGERTGENWWGSEGQIMFAIPCNMAGKHVRMTVVYSADISGSWGSNSSAYVSGNKAVYEVWNAPSTFDITVQTKDKGISISSVSFEEVK